ncbi:TRAP transporter small permease [Devosia sp. 919]|uniref:TRAP transporter small permease n=1 Tax=Devosia sp. 919 TaxID=2726065 RepID=UPI0015517B38|nr:TRAP transporter small permease [Devosia sp. 919]
MPKTTLHAWSRFIGQATYALTWVAAAAMVMMIVLIVVSVFMRYALHQPLLGSNELIQLTSVVLVMAALPYCTFEEGHIRVDILDNFIGRWGRLIGDLVFRLTSIFVLSLLSYRAVIKGLDALRWGDATNMLSLPIWPLYIVLATGSALCVLVFVGQTILIVTERDAS